MAKKKISIITPCFNEEDNIGACLQAVKSLFANELKAYDYEHIVADNCSSDSTPAVLLREAQSDTRLKVILNARNFGIFRSMFNAMEKSTGDAVIPFLPADLQDPPSLIPQFVSLWEDGFEIVAGKRTNREEGFFIKKFRSVFYYFLNKLSDFDVPQQVGEFQLIDRKVVNAVLSYRMKEPFIRTLIASVGFKTVVVPYDWKKRKVGKSKFSFFNNVDMALSGMFLFSSVPLRICTLIGLVVAGFCFALGFYILAVALLGLASPPEGTFTLLLSVLFLFGLQLIFFGIMGEYLLQVHSNTIGGRVVYERAAINFEGDARPLEGQTMQIKQPADQPTRPVI